MNPSILRFILIGLLAYTVIAYYGAARDFEVYLNASEIVTPLMLKGLYDVLHTYMVFLFVLLVISRR